MYSFHNKSLAYFFRRNTNHIKIYNYKEMIVSSVYFFQLKIFIYIDPLMILKS